jgi:hypothetical protein
VNASAFAQAVKFKIVERDTPTSMALLPSFDERRLLVTDLDGALVGGDTAGLHQLQRALGKARETLLLVYVSGRQLFEQVETIEKHQLLLPDYIISFKPDLFVSRLSAL